MKSAFLLCEYKESGSGLFLGWSNKAWSIIQLTVYTKNNAIKEYWTGRQQIELMSVYIEQC